MMLLGQSPLALPGASPLGGLYGLQPDLNQAAVANNGFPTTASNPAQTNASVTEPAGQPSSPAQPFVWGAGGTRLTQEQLALRQKQALANVQPDYSPIQSPWQGAARVAQNLVGALEQKSIDKQIAAQQSAGDQILTALAATDPASYNPSLVAQALASQDPRVQGLGKDIYDRAHPKPTKPDAFQQTLIDGGVQPGTPDWQRYNFQRAQSQFDPVVNVTLPTGVFAGPRSMLPASGAGAPTAAGVPTSRQLPNGTTAYFVNGDWYDNPEGK